MTTTTYTNEDMMINVTLEEDESGVFNLIVLGDNFGAVTDELLEKMADGEEIEGWKKS